MTFYNGKENYNLEERQKDLNIKTYFCDPYAAWQKGANENHNGVLRKYIPTPMGTQFNHLGNKH